MGNKNKANAWFDQTDDRKPFDAFENSEEKKRIGVEIFNRVQQEIYQRKRKLRYYILAAAAILIMVTVGISFFYFNTDLPASWMAYRTEQGEFRKISLADGSIVYLRPGSRLEAPKAFAQTSRIIKLIEGEAYFEVRHDVLHPFIVQTGQLSTRVLGTTFILKNYGSLRTVQVSLITGKVAVSHKGQQIGVLLPNQRLNFDETNQRVSLETFNANLASDWKIGEYILKEVQLKELALVLNNVYGFKVRFSNRNLEDLKITTQFNKSDKLENILEQLKMIHGLDYRITDKEVILKK